MPSLVELPPDREVAEAVAIRRILASDGPVGAVVGSATGWELLEAMDGDDVRPVVGELVLAGDGGTTTVWWDPQDGEATVYVMERTPCPDAIRELTVDGGAALLLEIAPDSTTWLGASDPAAEAPLRLAWRASTAEDCQPTRHVVAVVRGDDSTFLQPIFGMEAP